MERSLYIEKFRNLGVKEGQKLILNRSIEKGKTGNLLILIGENNSGKSNVLDALEEFGSQRMQERDKTDLEYSDESQIPKLSLSCKVSDGEFYTYGFDYDGKIYYKHTTPETQSNTPYKLSEKIISNFLSAVQQFQNSYGSLNGSNIQNLTAQVKAFKDPIDVKKAQPLVNNLIQSIDYAIRNRLGSRYKEYFINLAPSNSIMSYYASLSNNDRDKIEAMKEEYKTRFGTDLLPSVYRYQQKPIETRDLSNDRNSDFLRKVLRIIGVSDNEIDNLYQRVRQTNNYGALSTEERKLNKKLEKVSKDFNRIYFRNANGGEEQYRFEFKLERKEIFINLFRGNNAINLDYQSTGFKWFFNLYFNLICGNSLKAGDIIIMDEPATNLHMDGQIELRRFLKDFAIANDLTIIIATHMPSLIDLDYLDEVRVITLNDGHSYIHNDFTTVNDSDPDTLKPIKLSLTVSNHILLNPDKKVVFVEGITDYNYTTAFKRLFNLDDVVFLPINGVGNAETDTQGRRDEIVKSLQAIRKHCPVLMVDGDAAGKSMKEFCTANKTELKVFSLDEIDPSFKSIESLFSAADLINHKIKSADGALEKRSSRSALLKTFCKEGDFSKTTIANFKKLFNFIDAL